MCVSFHDQSPLPNAMSFFCILLVPTLQAVVLEQQKFALFVLTTYYRKGNFQYVVRIYSFIQVLLTFSESDFLKALLDR